MVHVTVMQPERQTVEHANMQSETQKDAHGR